MSKISQLIFPPFIFHIFDYSNVIEIKKVCNLLLRVYTKYDLDSFLIYNVTQKMKQKDVLELLNWDFFEIFRRLFKINRFFPIQNNQFLLNIKKNSVIGYNFFQNASIKQISSLIINGKWRVIGVAWFRYHEALHLRFPCIEEFISYIILFQDMTNDIIEFIIVNYYHLFPNLKATFKLSYQYKYKHKSKMKFINDILSKQSLFHSLNYIMLESFKKHLYGGSFYFNYIKLFENFLHNNRGLREIVSTYLAKKLKNQYYYLQIKNKFKTDYKIQKQIIDENTRLLQVYNYFNERHLLDASIFQLFYNYHYRIYG